MIRMITGVIALAAALAGCGGSISPDRAGRAPVVRGANLHEAILRDYARRFPDLFPRASSLALISVYSGTGRCPPPPRGTPFPPALIATAESLGYVIHDPCVPPAEDMVVLRLGETRPDGRSVYGGEWVNIGGRRWVADYMFTASVRRGVLEIESRVMSTGSPPPRRLPPPD
jgi:hypothetical protein